jgi:hypothetical protein
MMYTDMPDADVRHTLTPLTVALALVLGVAESASAGAAVTSCLDEGGDDTLRHAVITANSADTINLSKLVCSKITLTHGALPVGIKDLTIQGPGAAKLTIDGNHADRVFFHAVAGTLTLKDITVANGAVVADKAYGGCIYGKGDLAMYGAALTGCKALGQSLGAGGAAFVTGSATLHASKVADNLADAAGSVLSGIGAVGGGIVATGTAQDTTIVHSLISGNTAHAASGPAEGGGIVAGPVSAKYSTFSGNHAVAIGDVKNYSSAGAIAALSTLFMANCTVDHNVADIGGAVSTSGSNNGFATIVQSTISGNTGNLAVGGIVGGTPVSIANSTIAFNDGGVFGGGGIVMTGAYELKLQSTIIADNTPTDIDDTNKVSGASNLVKVVGASIALPAGTIRLDPQFGPLALNGGPTRTHALGAGSPAIDAGSNDVKLPSDQRSGPYARVVGPKADIGAVEFDPDRIYADGFSQP